MPLPLIAVAAVGAVAAVSYLTPLIIACIVGAATTIASFLVARTVYKKKDKSESSELRKEQKKRERKTRMDAEKTAQRVGHNVDLILNRSKEQQQQFGASIQTFSESIYATSQATDNLERVAESIQHVASAATITVETMSSELERLKSELIAVNTTLQGTQDALTEKERELTVTIDKLALLEVTINQDTRENTLRLAQFTEELSQFPSLLYHSNDDSHLKDAEITSLREKNSRMTSTIKILETTIERLTSKLTGAADLNQARLGEIRTLLTENKRLTCLIDSLSNVLENQESMTSNQRSSTTSKIRMFHSVT